MQFQTPPALGNQYEDDSVLRSYLKQCLPDDVLREPKSERLRQFLSRILHDNVATSVSADDRLITNGST